MQAYICLCVFEKKNNNNKKKKKTKKKQQTDEDFVEPHVCLIFTSSKLVLFSTRKGPLTPTADMATTIRGNLHLFFFKFFLQEYIIVPLNKH